MRFFKDAKRIPTDNKLRRFAAVTILCNVILLLLFVACLLIYFSINRVNTYNQNIESITNIATSNSQLMESALDSTSHEVVRAYNYCAGKSETEILDYLSLINAPEEEYQLLRRDEKASAPLYHVYVGYSTRKTDGEYTPVEYEDTSLSYSLYKYAAEEDGVISYSQAFTNRTDALRYFAVFCGVAVEEDGELRQYYLIKPQKESAVIDTAQANSQYSDLSMAICYTDGKYLAHDDGFRGDNFYNYLYDYNGLSVDERNAIRDSVQSNEEKVGILNYKDYQRRDCVFAYAACGEDDNWLVIAAVPESEFVAERALTALPLIIIIFLIILLSFNIFRLLVIVRELRSSVSREQLANASKSSFLSRMSHEIRTPLNAIIGYNTIARGEMLGAKNDVERKTAEIKTIDCLEKSRVASKHLLSIINDVLDMSAIDSGKIKIAHERFDFKGLITSLTTVFYSQAKAKGIAFEVVFDTLTEEWFMGDQMRVNQILTNLLSNAVKFTSTGGSVTLRIHRLDSESDSKNTRIQFLVEDTGIGMTPEQLEHVWDPFEQADSSISRRFGGTGLGLTITKTLVDLMDGTIEVESIPGVGTTFRVELAFESAQQPVSPEAYDFSMIHALVVDDDPGTCDYVRLLFNRCGAKCAAVTSGADAIKAISVAHEKGEDFSVCLVDWQMPQMDGIETIRRIRDIVGENLPIIILTAYDYTEIAAQAAEVSVDRFISKPLFQSALFDLLAGISGTGSPIRIAKREGADFEGAGVLLAEDNEMNMEIAHTILTSLGLVVEGVWNGKECVERFAASQPGTYRAILMDIHMPVMNGHEAARIIRASAHPEAGTIPIIAMTADAFAENVAEAQASGMNDHIAKPINITTLLDTLRRYI